MFIAARKLFSLTPWMAIAVVLSTVSFSIGLAQRVEASCGDYLQHSPSGLDSDSKANSQGQPSDSSTPTCKSGKCQSIPVPAPTSPTRTSIVRQHGSIWYSPVDRELQMQSRFFSTIDDRSPEQPFLEVAVPPPRGLFS